MASPRTLDLFVLLLLPIFFDSFLAAGAASTSLQYHKGPLLTSPINVYILWYGSFSATHTAVVRSFFASFSSPAHPKPTVSTWWATTQAYKDSTGRPVSSTVRLAGEFTDKTCSIGKNLMRGDITTLVRAALARRNFPYDPTAVYLVLTAPDVTVERFCMNSCGFHENTRIFRWKTGIVAHVGEPGRQCPGFCAWPYAKPPYGPPGPPLVAPNGVGVDGMIINIATVLAGASTNPDGLGYFEGNQFAPLEAATACAGMFGPGAYPGYPGKLLVDQKSKASFNAYGGNGRLHLLPDLWDPLSGKCKPLA